MLKQNNQEKRKQKLFFFFSLQWGQQVEAFQARQRRPDKELW